MPTPNGVVYQTPINVDDPSPETVGALTPYNGGDDHDVVMMTSPSASADEEWESDSESEVDLLPLMWNGHNRSDVHAMFQQARIFARNGDTDSAEALFQNSVKGYQHLIGPMHEETNKVVFALATFYFEQDHLEKAYNTLEKSGGNHLRGRGIQDRRTQQHIANIVQLLHGWGKEDDALAFLARAKEATEHSKSRLSSSRRRKSRKSHAETRLTDTNHNETIAEATRSIRDNPQDIDQLSYGLSVARTHALADSEATGALLRITIEQCGKDVDKLAAQRLKAWGELLRFYQRASNRNANIEVFKQAHSAFHDVLDRFPWHVRTRNKFRSFEVIEAALELVAPFVKAKYASDAKRMFQVCEDKALAYFSDEDERTIWMFISIGMVYQRYTDWAQAEPWFQRAWNAAMEKFDEDDGICISLEEAMEAKHFSYINDEGRPYRTIFGVSGLKIMPMRLHME
jgi:tetratricopeptide (TPR) repeat protein